MFKELAPLLRHRSVLFTVSHLGDDQFRVNVVPKKIDESENAALTIPVSVSGTAEDLDAQLADTLVNFVRRTPATVLSPSRHGVYSVAHPLRLDYVGLKKRLDGVSDPKKKAAKPAFVELIADHSATLADCVIEFESSVGSKMRIQWRASTAPDWISLFRAWRESER